MNKKVLTMQEVLALVDEMVARIPADGMKKVYGIPRGGVPVALALCSDPAFTLVDTPEEAEVFVDDIIDSGKTRDNWVVKYPGKLFFSLLHDGNRESGTWYVFPWENAGAADTSAEDIPLRMLQRIGEDPERDGLRDTPARVVRSWDELYKGYKEDPAEHLRKRFDNEEHYNEMVLLRDIEYYSTCEHHVLPFFGKMHVAYIPKPDGRIVGISKIARMVDGYARRLQVQERLTQQVADAMQSALDPMGVAVYCEGQHLCMLARGARQHESVMVTSALRGVCLEQAARLEFLLLTGRR